MSTTDQLEQDVAAILGFDPAAPAKRERAGRQRALALTLLTVASMAAALLIARPEPGPRSIAPPAPRQIASPTMEPEIASVPPLPPATPISTPTPVTTRASDRAPVSRGTVKRITGAPPLDTPVAANEPATPLPPASPEVKTPPPPPHALAVVTPPVSVETPVEPEAPSRQGRLRVERDLDAIRLLRRQ